MNPIDRIVQRSDEARLRNGFGDPVDELTRGEWVSERKSCPHSDCEWTLDTQWMNGATITRWRGHIHIDRECQAHLESHLPPLAI